MASTGEIATILFLVVAIAVVGYLYFIAERWHRKNTDSVVITRGIAGRAGESIQITCPSQKKIRVDQAHQVCGGMDSTGQPSPLACDPMLQNGNFNPKTTQDVKSHLSQICDGSNSCTIQVSSSSPCQGCAATDSMLIGTYDCIPTGA